MASTELRLLMQAVLDGEASPAEAAELERVLAASPAAREEFEQFRRLFDELAAVPRRHPPEGLAAAIRAALPVVPSSGQLSAVSRVLRPSSEGIYPGGDVPATPEQETPAHQPRSQLRRFLMTQPHPPYSAKRKAWLGAGIALVAVAIVVRYGFDTVPKPEDVAGTVVAAQRYRAPQGAADIRLGDQTMAQLMQNDAFVKLIRDPQVQAMAREPGFVEAARLFQSNPDLARQMAAFAEPAKKALATPELAKAMEVNAEATRAVRLATEAAVRLQGTADAQKILSGSKDLARYVNWLAEMSKVAPWRASMDKAESAELVALNAAFAQRFAEHAAKAEKVMASKEVERLAMNQAELQKFMQASEAAARMAQSYTEAAKVLAASAEASQLAATNVEAARFLYFNSEAARLLAHSPDLARVVLNNAEATRVLLAQPEASRHLLQNAEAGRQALLAAAADRSTR
jgi:hypothetical protein